MSLLHAIETCLRLSQVPPSRFGRDSVKDPRLVHDLRRGRQPGRRVEERVRRHIEQVLKTLPDPRAASRPNPASRPTSASSRGSN